MKVQKILITVASLLITDMTVCVGRVPDETLRKMQEQAIKDGWTYRVGRTGATERPDESLCPSKPTAANDSLLAAKLREFQERSSLMSMDALPSVFDWRELGKVTSVKDQGPTCGCCSAFAAVAVVESAILINSELSPWDIDLSEQWLVSCTVASSCGGGRPEFCLSAMMWDTLEYRDECQDEGAVLEVDCPYRATDEGCSCPYKHPYGIKDFHMGGVTGASIKSAIFEHGPVAVCMNLFQSFQAYQGGIYNTHWGNQSGSHYVVLVGWDDHPPEQPDGPGVWILRNSWGPDWGEAGYMRITYDEFFHSQVFLPGYNSWYAEYEWDKDPVEAQWAFDEGSGQVAHDSLGDNDGTLHGAAWTTGIVGSALEFDGQGYVELPESIVIRNEYAKSVCAWVRVEPPWPYNTTVFGWNDGRNTALLGLGGWQGSIAAGNVEWSYTWIGYAGWSMGEWHHVCFTYDGASTRIYVDGQETQVQNDYWGGSVNEGAHIGKGLTGKIDQVYVSSAILSHSTIWHMAHPGVGDPAFSVKDNSGRCVAFFDDLGNLVLTGSLTQNATPTATAADEFRVQDFYEVDVAIIDGSTGNMVIKGTKKTIPPDWPWIPPCSFVVKGSDGKVVAYIDSAGDLYLKGNLYERTPEP